MTRKRALTTEFDPLIALVEEAIGGPLYDPSFLDPRRQERKRGGQAIAGRYRGISSEDADALDAAFQAVLKERGPLSAERLAGEAAALLPRAQKWAATKSRAATFLRRQSKP